MPICTIDLCRVISTGFLPAQFRTSPTLCALTSNPDLPPVPWCNHAEMLVIPRVSVTLFEYTNFARFITFRACHLSSAFQRLPVIDYTNHQTMQEAHPSI